VFFFFSFDLPFSAPNINMSKLTQTSSEEFRIHILTDAKASERKEFRRFVT